VFGCIAAQAHAGTQRQWLAALACGNTVLVALPEAAREQAAGVLAYWREAGLPAGALQLLEGPFDVAAAAVADDARVAGLLCEPAAAGALRRRVAARPGAIVPVIAGDPAAALWRLAAEQTLTINTAAAGGNAALLAGA
ncbi:MAG TPA: aldehyde dehydrogenase family protein, partial [Burkholderiaceae bacterium]|nr:aldehyde dehydrogenase family protein [Burkholderiaceae bacterium]